MRKVIVDKEEYIMKHTVFYYKEREEWCLFDPYMNLVKDVYYFLVYLREESIKDNSAKQFAYSLKSLHEFIFYNQLKIEEFTFDNLMEFRTWKLQPEEHRENPVFYLNRTSVIVPETWDAILNAMIQYFAWLCLKGRNVNVQISFMRIEQKKTRGSKKDVKKSKLGTLRIKKKRRIVENIDEEHCPLIREKLNKRDKLIFDIFYFTGMRLGELFSMSIDKFPVPKSDDGVICIELDPSSSTEGNRQTKTNARTIFLPRTLYMSVRRYITYGRKTKKHKYLFTVLKNTGKSSLGDALSPDTFRENLHNACKKINVYCSPHMIRHTFATSALAKTNDLKFVQYLMGHKSIESTAKYTHPNIDETVKKLNTFYEEVYSELMGGLD